MAHPTDKRNLLYAKLMEEVKVRFECINLTTTGKTGLAAPFAREFCWLQVRMLCELVALACLVAHGDIASLHAHKVGKSYSADEILDRLAKLRPHFYPFAIKETLTNPGVPTGQRRFNASALDPQPFPKESLLALYGKSHRYVHRGSLKKLLSSDSPLDMNVDFPEIVRPVQGLSDLLSNHIIAISETHLIGCILKNREDRNRVQVVTVVKSDVT